MGLGLPPEVTGRFLGLVNSLLDAGYAEHAAPVINAINYGSRSGALAESLRALEQEAARLAVEGGRLNPNSPFVRVVLTDFENAMQSNEELIRVAGRPLQDSGLEVASQSVLEGAVVNLPPDTAGAIRTVWNQPSAEALRSFVDYTQSPAWAARLDRYGTGVPDLVRQLAIRGFAQGLNPRNAAREIRRAVETMPASYADQLMRTAQLTSFRDGELAYRMANADLLAYQIRIAALDARTCMACVALHGTRMAIDERVDDHHNGRCTSISVVNGQSPPVIQTGPEWFEQQPPSAQQAQMGQQAYRDWQAGRIEIGDFVGHYEDDVYGPMVQQRSLKEILSQ